MKNQTKKQKSSVGMILLCIVLIVGCIGSVSVLFSKDSGGSASSNTGTKSISTTSKVSSTSSSVQSSEIPSPSYTNLLPLAIDTDGLLYNEVGYKDLTRITSSGIADSTDARAQKLCTTGFISCTITSTIYFKNCNITVGDDPSVAQCMVFYDASFNQLKNISLSSLKPDSNYFEIVADENNNIISINASVLADQYENVAYVRFAGLAGGFTSESIITVDEPIE